MLGKIKASITDKLVTVLVWTNAITDASKGIIAIFTFMILVQETLKKFLGINSSSKLN